MRNKLFALAALASALSFSASARAQDDAQSADVRCLIVTIKVMAAANTDEIKSSTLAGAMYFMGKLDGRQPGFDLESAVVTQLGTMKPEDIGREGQRCGAELQTRGASLQQIGNDLTSKGY
jgi:hypothetical protein